MNWIHLKALKAFAESVLQYGLPSSYLMLLAEEGNEGKRRGSGLSNSLVQAVCSFANEHGLRLLKLPSSSSSQALTDDAATAVGLALPSWMSDSHAQLPFITIDIRLISFK
jgi:V-ATPase subunit C